MQLRASENFKEVGDCPVLERENSTGHKPDTPLSIALVNNTVNDKFLKKIDFFITNTVNHYSV